MILDALQKEIADKVAVVSEFGKTRDAMIELMRQHNIEGTQDAHRFEVIRENYEFEAARIATESQEVQRMVAHLAAKHHPFIKECFAESGRINKLLIPLLVAGRDELELSISKEKYAEILFQAQFKATEHVNDVLQKASGVPANNAAHLS